MSRPHGTRAKYVVEQCRCDYCRAANAAYYHQTKRRIAPRTVGAARARRHMLELADQGVGYKTVADAAGIGRSTAFKIVKGEVQHIRPDTEHAILGVTALNAADGNYTDAAPTWRLIEQLLDNGWTKDRISAALGNNGRALQVNRHRVRVSTAKAIAELARTAHITATPAPTRTPPEPPPFWEGDTSWMHRGACRNDDTPTWLFFAGRGDSRTTEAAKKVCAGCSVTQECLDYALRNRAVGIWGGTSGAERRGMKPSTFNCVDCGTEIEMQRVNQPRCDDYRKAMAWKQKYGEEG